MLNTSYILNTYVKQTMKGQHTNTHTYICILKDQLKQTYIFLYKYINTQTYIYMNNIV